MASTAVRLDPGDYQARWSLGWAYLYHRQHDKALAEYARASELNPNDAELITETANMLIFMGEPKQAIEQAKEGIRLNPFHENWYVEYLGWAAEAGMPKRLGRFSKAIDLRKPADDQL
jgi:tetratricopeptide (TPR) repeat protein